jgi:hypothetical protein
VKARSGAPPGTIGAGQIDERERIAAWLKAQYPGRGPTATARQYSGGRGRVIGRVPQQQAVPNPIVHPNLRRR